MTLSPYMLVSPDMEYEVRVAIGSALRPKRERVVRQLIVDESLEDKTVRRISKEEVRLWHIA